MGEREGRCGTKNRVARNGLFRAYLTAWLGPRYPAQSTADERLPAWEAAVQAVPDPQSQVRAYQVHYVSHADYGEVLRRRLCCGLQSPGQLSFGVCDATEVVGSTDRV